MKFRVAQAGACLALCVSLAACGGEGSSSAPAATSGGGATPTPTPTTASATLPPGPAAAFSNMTASSGIAHSFGFSAGLNPMVAQFAGGAASGDVDGDGDIDVFVTRGDSGPNLLYLNRGDGNFVDGAASAGLAFTLGGSVNGQHSGPTFADLDGDGDLDLLLGGFRFEDNIE